MPNVIPGKKGTDYQFVRYGDKVYVVYRVTLPGGKSINVSWRVSADDYKAFGIKPDGVKKITKAAFGNLNVFGDASEIAAGNKDEHPFQTYVKELRERYGGVSWLGNQEFMETMLMGYAEGWTASELEQSLKTTAWYQKRTDAQRAWELDYTKAERSSSMDVWRNRLNEALGDLLGEGMDVKEMGVTGPQLKRWAEQIASGKWGDPNDGFEVWLSRMRNRAEKVEGSAAWIERESALEQQRAFMNRPEDVKEQIRQEASEWLGPRGVPDDETLQKWSERLVSEKASDADWQQFLRNQAQTLYPWLGPDERWQDRAAIYKRIVEDNWGQPIDWDNRLLYRLGEKDASGGFTGQALGYDEFERVVRSKDEFWQGPVAKQEGFELYNYLNETFNGVR